VEQLGSDKPEVRLGGIYSLERISKESPADYWTVMENLATMNVHGSSLRLSRYSDPPRGGLDCHRGISRARAERAVGHSPHSGRCRPRSAAG
jgi:hypothetical protein